MGKKSLELNEDQIYKLAVIGCTYKEVANLMGCSVDVISRKYTTAMKRGNTDMKKRLRASQLKLAEAGNATMQIWLGKQMLGQTNKDELQVTGKDGGPIAQTLQIEFITAPVKE